MITRTILTNRLATGMLLLVLGGGAIACLNLGDTTAAIALVLGFAAIFTGMVGHTAKRTYEAYAELLYKGLRQVNHNVLDGQWTPPSNADIDLFRLEALQAAKRGCVDVTVWQTRYTDGTRLYDWKFA